MYKEETVILKKEEKYKKITDHSVFRFALVGVLNTLIGTAVMFLCYRFLGFGYWLSSAMNYVIGSIFSYFANKYFTFQSNQRSLAEIVRFVLNISVCYLLAYGAAKPGTKWLLVRCFGEGMEKETVEQAAMLVGMGLFIVINYFGQRLFVFGKKGDSNAS